MLRRRVGDATTPGTSGADQAEADGEKHQATPAQQPQSGVAVEEAAMMPTTVQISDESVWFSSNPPLEPLAGAGG